MKAPSHLKLPTQAWFDAVIKEYELEPHHIKLLILAAETWDRAQEARAIIDKEGISYIDRFGSPRKRPEVDVERDSRIGFARLIRELDLDVEAPQEAKRPPALRSNRR